MVWNWLPERQSLEQTSKSDIERAEMRFLSWPTEPYDEGGSF